jgi:hypothetical protein
VKSCIDISIERAERGEDAPGASMSRFWFHIKENGAENVYPNFVENSGIVKISECPVVLLTEKQMADSNGNLSDVKEGDPVGDEFARIMTEQFPVIVDSVESYAMLENYFRLHALFLAMRHRQQLNTMHKAISSFFLNASFATTNKLPDYLDGLVNIKQTISEEKSDRYISTQKRVFMVSGGVGMEMKVNERNISVTKEIASLRKRLIASRPGRNKVYWKARG